MALGLPPSTRRAAANGYLLPQKVFRDSLTVREFLTIAISTNKVVEMATNEDHKKAVGLQKALETVSPPPQPQPQPRIF